MKVAAFLICFLISETLSQTNCDFNAARSSFCRWKREWFGMRKAGWKTGNSVRKFSLEDQNFENGKFAYFLSKSRPIGFQSRLRSPSISPSKKSCFNFWVALGGSELPFPKGNSALKLYMVPYGAAVESQIPIWTKVNGVRDVNSFEKISLPLNEITEFRANTPIQFVFEAIRGTSKKCLVAIDNISLEPCDQGNVTPKQVDPLLDIELKTKKNMNGVNSETERNMNGVDIEKEENMNDVEKAFMSLMLPAKRQVATLDFQDLDGTAQLSTLGLNGYNPNVDLSSPNSSGGKTARKVKRLKKVKRRRRKGRKGRRGKKRRKSKRRQRRLKNKRRHRNRQKKQKKLNIPEPFLFPIHPPSSSLSVMCDFIEYTRRLRGCLRDFFSELQRRPKRCGKQYELLESCIKKAAVSCVPSRDLNQTRIEEIVDETLRENFKLREVFCEEDGAFVFPQFPMDKLPIHCGARYFVKLSECSGSFNSMFHVQHGNPELCRTYYKANQCQRQATAEECNFDVETMLLYGLNLQYQITYNPFCLNLPFSSWWPQS